MTDPALQIEGLTVNYGRMHALWDISCALPQNTVTGIIGPNGAGKSTLLKSLLGMVEMHAGDVHFFGMPLKRARARIAYIPQRNSVDWEFPITAFELVLMGRYGRLGYFKWPKRADREAALRALEQVGMARYADRQINELSGGQQQRLFFARALLQDAELYLMDEPFSGVDMATESALVHLIGECKKQGKTFLIVHHDLSSVESYFDWVMMLNVRLVACGPVEKAFDKETIARTYGKGSALLEEALQLKSQHLPQGYTAHDSKLDF